MNKLITMTFAKIGVTLSSSIQLVRIVLKVAWAFLKYNWLRLLFFGSSVIILLALGVWQWHRAEWKEGLLRELEERQAKPVFFLKAFPSPQEQSQWRYRRAQVKIQLNREQRIVLENRFLHHQYGYELLVPFQISGSSQTGLLDLGWFLYKVTPSQALPQELTLTGSWLPPSLGALPFQGHFSRGIARVNQLELDQLSQKLAIPLFPLVLHSDVSITGSAPMPITITTVSPSRHRGYAIQWFIFAGISLATWIALERRGRREA